MTNLTFSADTFGEFFQTPFESDEAAFKALAAALEKAVTEYTGRTNDHAGWPWDGNCLARLDLLRRGVKPSFSLDKREVADTALCCWVGSPSGISEMLIFKVNGPTDALIAHTDKELAPGVFPYHFHRFENGRKIVWV